MTRQRRWQLRKIAEGGCMICGKPRITGDRCQFHAEEKLRFARERYSYSGVPTSGPALLKYRARYKLASAVRSGRLARPPRCSQCGVSHPKITADHHDYTKPLDVTWLCYVCHHRVTEERRAAGVAP